MADEKDEPRQEREQDEQDEQDEYGEPGERDEQQVTGVAGEQELREQLRALHEETRRFRQEAAARERELRDQIQQEFRSRAQEARDRRHDERAGRGERGERGERGDRGDRRDRRDFGRRGGPYGGWPTPGMPPMGPPMPPMPPAGPLPPISGAGGTFTPFDFLSELGPLFGGGPRGGGRRRHGGRSRAGRGDVRITVLILLDEGPANGYQLMQAIEQRTNGAWKPSSGSIYPALQQLEDEGIVRIMEGEGRKMFALTDEGRQYVQEHRAEWTAPWEGIGEDDGGASEEAVRIRDVIAQLAMAYMQVIQVGTESQREEAARVLVGTRQALYRILAADSPQESEA